LLNTQTGKLVYYNEDEQKFYEANADGTNPRALSDQLFPDAQDIVWSNQGDKAIISFPDNSKIAYDFSARKQYSLPKEAEGFSFSPDGAKIAYKYLPSDVEDRWLVSSSLDSSGVKYLETIGDEADNVEVNWSPKGDIVATFRKGLDGDRQEVYFIGQNKENFKSAVTEGRGFTGKWSTDGNQLLYSVYNESSNYNPELYIVNGSGDAIGSGRTDLDLQTWPSKCSFGTSSTMIYCAVPSFLPSGSGLYPDQASTTQDQFYEINVATGQKRFLADPAYGVSASNLFFSNDGKTLYFTNQRTGRLESIRLP
jgi:Tol biopolymer transport system component